MAKRETPANASVDDLASVAGQVPRASPGPSGRRVSDGHVRRQASRGGRSGRGRRARAKGGPTSIPRLLLRPVVLVVVTVLSILAVMTVLAVLGQDLPGMLAGAAVTAAALAAVTAGIFAFMALRDLRSVKRGQRTAGRGERRRDARDRARHARTRRAVDHAERRLFAQLEAMGWLRDLLALEHPLPPTRHWAASPDLLLELVRIIDRVKPHSVLELGSGVSSVVMAARLKALGQGHLVSLEHEPGYAEETRRNLALHGLEGVATVLDAPLAVVRIGEADWRWYELPAEELPTSVQLLLVDGPPGATGPLARYPALPQLATRLAPGATIVMDDADRPDEREVARRWQAEHAGLSFRHLPLESGAFVLRLPD